MIDSNLKQIYFIKIIQTTGSHSLIIDLSNDVFFHVFIIFLQKFRRLKWPSSDQNTGAGARQNRALYRGVPNIPDPWK